MVSEVILGACGLFILLDVVLWVFPFLCIHMCVHWVCSLTLVHWFYSAVTKSALIFTVSGEYILAWNAMRSVWGVMLGLLIFLSCIDNRFVACRWVFIRTCVRRYAHIWIPIHLAGSVAILDGNLLASLALKLFIIEILGCKSVFCWRIWQYFVFFCDAYWHVCLEHCLVPADLSTVLTCQVREHLFVYLLFRIC